MMSIFLAIDRLRDAFSQLEKQLSAMKNQIDGFIKENPDFIDNLKTYFKNIPDIHSEIWRKAAENGWFANWLTSIEFDTAVLAGKDELDKFMIAHIEKDLADIESTLIGLYPERASILRTAFELHRQGNYIASIPLFISQSDGICAQNLKSYLFTEHDRRAQKISQIIEEVPDEFGKVFWAPLTAKTQFGASINHCKKKDKEKAPNRSGIMHGSRKHIDYGTKYNSLKSISFLAYIAFIFEEPNR
jgi:hypothetical protein